MKYFLIIKRPNHHYQVSTESKQETWVTLEDAEIEKTLAYIIKEWIKEKEKGDTSDKKTAKNT